MKNYNTIINLFKVLMVVAFIMIVIHNSYITIPKDSCKFYYSEIYGKIDFVSYSQGRQRFTISGNEEIYNFIPEKIISKSSNSYNEIKIGNEVYKEAKRDVITFYDSLGEELVYKCKNYCNE